MALARFFLESQVLAAEDKPVFPLDLSSKDTHHARVLRLAPGEHIAIIDADQDYFECEIVSFDEGTPLVRIAQRNSRRGGRPSVLLAQGLAKADKMDQVLRQVTELGVAGFIPLGCERSIVHLDAAKAEKRVARWKEIAKSAAMQSGQNRIPQVWAPTDLKGLASLASQAACTLIFWEESDESSLLGGVISSMLDSFAKDPHEATVVIVIGPEGGLSAHEVEYLLAHCPRSFVLSLGSSILRTETAGVVACALTLYELGLMGPRQGLDRAANVDV